jgi:hypothetical protein
VEHRTLHMVFNPGALSVIACPAQRQSAEAVRRIRGAVIKAGAKLEIDNTYGLELNNGSRVLALPGSDDSIRGLTVDGWIIADEAARLESDLIAALRPMRARRPHARFAMLSTAWTRTDPFWTAWASDDLTWVRLKATADTEASLFAPGYLDQERRALGEHALPRISRHSWRGRSQSIHLGFVRACDLHPGAPGATRRGLCPAAPGCSSSDRKPVPESHKPRSTSMMVPFNRDIPSTWPYFRPTIIAHDVGGRRDRSTAVVGGNSPFQPRLLGITEFNELPQGLYGSARASALAEIDRRYYGNAIIVADLSNDASYAEPLYETFGPRVIGLLISRFGDGMNREWRPVGGGGIPIYCRT